MILYIFIYIYDIIYILLYIYIYYYIYIIIYIYIVINKYILVGFKTSKNYESQLGVLFPIDGKSLEKFWKKKNPKHQTFGDHGMYQQKHGG